MTKTILLYGAYVPSLDTVMCIRETKEAVMNSVYYNLSDLPFVVCEIKAVAEIPADYVTTQYTFNNAHDNSN